MVKLSYILYILIYAQLLYNSYAMENIGRISTITVSSYHPLGLTPNYLNDGIRGSQSTGKYWNDGSQYVNNDVITVTFDRPYVIDKVVLMMPVMDISGPYVLGGIYIQLLYNGNVVYTSPYLYLRGDVTESLCIDGIVYPSTTQVDVIATSMNIMFGAPNVDGWVFLGEIQVFQYPSTLNSSISYLATKSTEIIRQAKTYTNNGITVFPPQLGSGYNAFWPRDYAYMIQGMGNIFTHDELLDIATMMKRSQRYDGSMPDAIGYDGTIYYQSGFGTMGTYPVADGSQFYIDIIYQTYRLTNDISLISRTMDSMLNAMSVIPIDQVGLFYIGTSGWERASYGFHDSVKKQGGCLFETLLYIQACRQLSEMASVIGDTAASSYWYSKSITSTNAINTILWDSNMGLYRAATIQNINHDIWGSAFAVRLNVTQGREYAIANYFKNYYSYLVEDGMIRALPPGQYWDVAVSARDTYQNGAYWAYSVGWFTYTLDLIDSSLADRTIRNMVKKIIRIGPYEWFYQTTYGVQSYLVSTSLPLESIKATIRRRNGLPVPSVPIYSQ